MYVQLKYQGSGGNEKPIQQTYLHEKLFDKYPTDNNLSLYRVCIDDAGVIFNDGNYPRITNLYNMLSDTSADDDYNEYLKVPAIEKIERNPSNPKNIKTGDITSKYFNKFLTEIGDTSRISRYFTAYTNIDGNDALIYDDVFGNNDDRILNLKLTFENINDSDPLLTLRELGISGLNLTQLTTIYKFLKINENKETDVIYNGSNKYTYNGLTQKYVSDLETSYQTIVNNINTDGNDFSFIECSLMNQATIKIQAFGEIDIYNNLNNVAIKINEDVAIKINEIVNGINGVSGQDVWYDGKVFYAHFKPGTALIDKIYFTNLIDMRYGNASNANGIEAIGEMGKGFGGEVGKGAISLTKAKIENNSKERMQKADLEAKKEIEIIKKLEIY